MANTKTAAHELRIAGEQSEKSGIWAKQRSAAKRIHPILYPLYHKANEKMEVIVKMKQNPTIRNEIKSYIIRNGMTMSEVVELLADEYGWSSSVPNLSGKLKRGSLRYGEAVELADVLGYDLVCQKRGK